MKIKINNFKENLNKIIAVTTDYRKGKYISVEYKDDCFYISKDDFKHINESQFYFTISFKDFENFGELIETIEIKTKDN